MKHKLIDQFLDLSSGFIRDFEKNKEMLRGLFPENEIIIEKEADHL